MTSSERDSRLLTRHPSGVLRVDVVQCTTPGRLRVCCWRAVQNQDCTKGRWPNCRSKMQVTMKKKWRHWAFCAVLAVGSALGASLLSDVRFFRILNLKAYDAHFIARDFLRGR